jgi:hypothetical protein
MEIAKIITNISAILWLLPIFRQYKTRYFFFFLVLGLTDPINIIIVSFLGIKPHFIHSIAGLLLITSLLDEMSWKKRYSLVIILLCLSAIIYFLNNFLVEILIFHFILFSIFIKRALTPFFMNNDLNIFSLCLVFYELTIVTKLIVFLNKTDIGIEFFYLTLLLETLLAIFFSLFRAKDKKMAIHLSLDS